MDYTTLIGAEALYAHLSEPTWAILDCRFRLTDPDTGRTLYEAAHIPGALYADLNRDLAGPPGGEAGRHPLPELDIFRRTVGNWGIEEGVQVVCYDDAGGSLAARLWWMLRYLGHARVAVLDGGWQAWLAQGYLTVSGTEQRTPTTFQGEPHPEMLASLEEVVALSAGGQGARLVDSRDARRYRGEIEPLDPVAGHIPGARNRPFSQNLAEDGTLRPPEALRAEWDALLGEQPPSDLILYCGSGVTACHNLLALEQAGRSGARLFVPSWSGWSADPTRPVETGELPDTLA